MSKGGDISKEKKNRLHTYYDSKYLVNIVMLIDYELHLWYVSNILHN